MPVSLAITPVLRLAHEHEQIVEVGEDGADSRKRSSGSCCTRLITLLTTCALPYEAALNVA